MISSNLMDFEINFETVERPFFKGHHDLFVYHEFLFFLYSNPFFFLRFFLHIFFSLSFILGRFINAP